MPPRSADSRPAPAAEPLSTRRARQRAALPAGRRAAGGAADGAAPAAARPRRRARARAGARAGHARPSATASAATRSPRTASARCAAPAARPGAAVRRRDAGRSRSRWSRPTPTTGLYFVLMGRLSPLDGIGPKEIRLDRLIRARHRRRRARGDPRDQLHQRGRGHRALHRASCSSRAGSAVSRLARGVPVGGELEYVDAGTLAQALRDRRPLSAPERPRASGRGGGARRRRPSRGITGI